MNLAYSSCRKLLPEAVVTLQNRIAREPIGQGWPSEQAVKDKRLIPWLFVCAPDTAPSGVTRDLDRFRPIGRHLAESICSVLLLPKIRGLDGCWGTAFEVLHHLAMLELASFWIEGPAEGGGEEAGQSTGCAIEAICKALRAMSCRGSRSDDRRGQASESVDQEAKLRHVFCICFVKGVYLQSAVRWRGTRRRLRWWVPASPSIPMALIVQLHYELVVSPLHISTML